MQLRDRYPADVVTGGCVITGDYSTDEPIVDLDLDVDTLPAFGRICISAKGVRLLNRCLGWDVDPDLPEQLDALRAQLDDAERENLALRNHLRTVAEALKVSQVFAGETLIEEMS